MSDELPPNPFLSQFKHPPVPNLTAPTISIAPTATFSDPNGTHTPEPKASWILNGGGDASAIPFTVNDGCWEIIFPPGSPFGSGKRTFSSAIEMQEWISSINGWIPATPPQDDDVPMEFAPMAYQPNTPYETKTNFVTRPTKDHVYIAGPISGYENFNEPAFRVAEKRLLAAGMKPLVPLDLNLEHGPIGSRSYEEYMAADVLTILQRCDSICPIDGWENSRGAKLEVHLALTLGLRFIDADGVEIPKPYLVIDAFDRRLTAAQRADKLVRGSRNKDYGPPINDLTCLGRLWGSLLGIPDIRADRVAIMMIALKLARLNNNFKEDSLVDLHGWSFVYDMVHPLVEAMLAGDKK